MLCSRCRAHLQTVAQTACPKTSLVQGIALVCAKEAASCKEVSRLLSAYVLGVTDCDVLGVSDSSCITVLIALEAFTRAPERGAQKWDRAI